MAKFRTRTAGKGKRWIKGNSCVTNPERTKHRDAAKSGFFQENLGKGNVAGSSLLTCDALQIHDSLLTHEQMVVEENEGLLDECNSVKTFASDWTNCTNQSFSKLLNGFETRSAHQKEMLAVLAAVTEIIKSQGGSEDTNEYFGALVTALDIEGTEENMAAIISLLKMAIRGVSQNILGLKFEELGQTFSQLLNKNCDSENNTILIGTIDCLAALLRAQDFSLWTQRITLGYFNLILAFTTHSKPRVRKCAQNNVISILKNKSVIASTSVHPGASYAATFCVSQLESPIGVRSGVTTILHTLGFLKSIIATFPRAQLKACCESILKVMTLGEPRITLCGLQALQWMLMKKAPESKLTSDLNARLISAMFDFRPDDDKDALFTWLIVMQEAYCRLAESDHLMCLQNIPQFAKQVGRLLEKDNINVLSGCALSLKTVILECLDCRSIGADILHQTKEAVSQIVKVATHCLRSQCHAAWKYVVHIFGALYQKLSMLREEQLMALGSHIDNALGLAARTMGPQTLLDILPLEINFDGPNVDFNNCWLLPVLADNICKAELAFFSNHIYMLAAKCKRRSEELTRSNATAAAHSFDILHLQLWSLLPGFCNEPTDFETGVKGIAKLLGSALNEKDLRIFVMAGLRKLVAFAAVEEHQGPRQVLANYAKNFLPILFSIYTTAPKDSQEEGQRLAAFETAKCYLQIANPALQHDLFDRAFEKLSGIEPPHGKSKRRKEKENEFKLRDALLQLLMVLVTYQTEERISKMYEIGCGLLASHDHKEQKRGYRLIEELAHSQSPTCKHFMQQHFDSLLQTLSDVLKVAKPPSRALEPQHRAQLEAWVPEAVLCCKDINEKCRTAAYTLMYQIGQTLQRWTNESVEDVIKQYLAIILPGLQGSVNLASATVLALSSLVYSYGDLLPKDMLSLLMFNISSLITCNTREIVGPCLSFYKTLLSTYDVDACRHHTETLVTSLVNMNEDCKRHFRMKTRVLLTKLMRRFGMDVLSSLVPQDDQIMLLRLKNIQKELERKSRDRKEKQLQGDSEDEDMDTDFVSHTKSKSIEEILADSDNDDLECDDKSEQTKTSKHKSKAWIRENTDSIMDFTDPTATRQVIATNPRTLSKPVAADAKDKNRGFKSAPDGRLIITADSDSEDGGDSQLQKKRKSGISIASDDDLEDEEVEESTTGRSVLVPESKRRRALSTSSDAVTEPAMKYKAGGSGIHRPSRPDSKPKSKNSDNTAAEHTGMEFRAKKARGDVKKKGKPDPYAKSKKCAGQLKRLESSAKKGAKRGKNARAKVLKSDIAGMKLDDPNPNYTWACSALTLQTKKEGFFKYTI
ncbi:hypothetical protein B566_EDAN010507 [Ephemera danica]|nr:hypothetical protein B566_EDAN010507 [Ephemera danica]